MILPGSDDAIHKTHLYRLLLGIMNDRKLSHALYFKGGTCAVLAGWLDRFSLDLDFDLAVKADKRDINSRLLELYKSLGFSVKEKRDLFYILQYGVEKGKRNSIKVSVVTKVIAANRYRPQYLFDINRYAICQTKDTMVANKLVAPLDRNEKYGTIAGRDIYDIHFFLSHGFPYRTEVIEERRNKGAHAYLSDLITFIEKRVTDRVIAEDLNYLLPPVKFQAVRRTLKDEVLILLHNAWKQARETSEGVA